MATVTETKEKVVVQPFAVEIDHPRNCDYLLQCIPGRQRMRGAVNAAKPSYGERAGIPADQARHLGRLPPIPGMQIHVNPAKGTYLIKDPLHGDEELCDRIQRGLEDDDRPVAVGAKLKGVPPKRGELDPHWMKSLCRELRWLLDAEHAKMAKGPEPVMEDIERLPGNFLQNPGSTIRNSQPRFEKDMAAWVANLDSQGG
jgi:hypothetical protein